MVNHRLDLNEILHKSRNSCITDKITLSLQHNYPCTNLGSNGMRPFSLINMAVYKKQGQSGHLPVITSQGQWLL